MSESFWMRSGNERLDGAKGGIMPTPAWTAWAGEYADLVDWFVKGALPLAFGFCAGIWKEKVGSQEAIRKEREAQRVQAVNMAQFLEDYRTKLIRLYEECEF